MKTHIRNVPWKKNKGESRMAAFMRQATPIAIRDQQRLISSGWKPMLAAIEAWLTMQAGE